MGWFVGSRVKIKISGNIWYTYRGVRLITHLYLMPRLGMIGTTPPLPLCAFVSCRGTALHSNYLLLCNGYDFGATAARVATIIFECNE
jgi:hypothetical protein